MRIAHLSDLHVLALEGAVPFRLFNKRSTGYANLRLKRKHAHKSRVVRAIAAHLSSSKVDHVVITRRRLQPRARGRVRGGATASSTTTRACRRARQLVPGNHDVYTRGAAEQAAFAQYFEPYLASDLPELAHRARRAARFPS